jgi:hypothetical protein
MANTLKDDDDDDDDTMISMVFFIWVPCSFSPLRAGRGKDMPSCVNRHCLVVSKRKVNSKLET